MESDSRDAHDALDAIGADRERVGARMTSETWWAAPAQGFAAALLVLAPAAGVPWSALLFAAAAGLFLGVETIFRKRSGIAVSRPAGPLGIALLLVLGIGLVLALIGSIALVVLDLRGWALALAAFAGVATALGVAGYDRVYAKEVHRAR